MARTLARPVLAKLCSTALSVESSICLSHDTKVQLHTKSKEAKHNNQSAHQKIILVSADSTAGSNRKLVIHVWNN